MIKQFRDLCGFVLATRDGRAGTVSDFFFDALEWKVRYLVIDKGSWLSRNSILLEPAMIEQVDHDKGSIRVDLDREEVWCAPPLEFNQLVSVPEKEMALCETTPPDQTAVSSGAAQGMTLGRSRCVAIPESDPMLLSSLLRYLRRSEPDLHSSGVLTRRYKFRAQDGNIGLVHDLVIDVETWQVRYFVVQRGFWPVEKKVLLPSGLIEGVSVEWKEIFVDLPRIAIMDAPAYDAGAPITPFAQQWLEHFYRRKRNCHSPCNRDQNLIVTSEG